MLLYLYGKKLYLITVLFDFGLRKGIFNINCDSSTICVSVVTIYLVALYRYFGISNAFVQPGFAMTNYINIIVMQYNAELIPVFSEGNYVTESNLKTIPLPRGMLPAPISATKRAKTPLTVLYEFIQVTCNFLTPPSFKCNPHFQVTKYYHFLSYQNHQGAIFYQKLIQLSNLGIELMRILSSENSRKGNLCFGIILLDCSKCIHCFSA